MPSTSMVSTVIIRRYTNTPPPTITPAKAEDTPAAAARPAAPAAAVVAPAVVVTPVDVVVLGCFPPVVVLTAGEPVNLECSFVLAGVVVGAAVGFQ